VAAKGGGAWKVAYADFVTAMMAFFLVMWICGQDQRIRKAVSDYFGDPLAVNHGVAKTPFRSGSLFESLRTGSVPEEESVAMGRGRKSFTPGENSRITKVVNDRLHADEKAVQYWRDAAQLQRRLLPTPTSDNPEQARAAKEMLILQVAQQMRDEVKRGVPAEAKGLYRDLLEDALTCVNWKQIVEDILSE
jgi:chemotaxis protein MotB